MAETDSWKDVSFITSKLYGRVIDIGCAAGDLSKRFLGMPLVKSVVSFDIRPKTYSHPSGRFCDVFPDGEFIQGDVRDMKGVASDSFDCVICWNLISHLWHGASWTGDPKDAYKGESHVPKALSEINRIVKNGGLVMIQDNIEFTEILLRNMPSSLKAIMETYESVGRKYNHLFQKDTGEK